MAYKIDITIIIKNHLKTLVNDGDGRPDFRDKFFFGFLPILVAAVLVYFKLFINKDFIASMICGLAIYVGLSLNLIVLLFEIVRGKDTSAFKKEFAREFIANVCFSILLSIATITTSLFTLLFASPAALPLPAPPPPPQSDICIILNYATNWVFYYLLTHMLLIILLLVKRLYYQLLEQID